MNYLIDWLKLNNFVKFDGGLFDYLLFVFLVLTLVLIIFGMITIFISYFVEISNSNYEELEDMIKDSKSEEFKEKFNNRYKKGKITEFNLYFLFRTYKKIEKKKIKNTLFNSISS